MSLAGVPLVAVDPGIKSARFEGSADSSMSLM